MTQRVSDERLVELDRWLESDSNEFPTIPLGDLIADLQDARALLAAQQEVIDAVRNWRCGLIDKQVGDDIGRLASTYPAIYRLAETFDKYEAKVGES